jgi:hypothetical protein
VAKLQCCWLHYRIDCFLSLIRWQFDIKMKVTIFLVLSLVGILQSVIVDAAKGKSAVAIPRKSKGNPISRSVFGSMFSRAFREMKVTFCSELEALTLQVKPFFLPTTLHYVRRSILVFEISDLKQNGNYCCWIEYSSNNITWMLPIVCH